MLASRFGKALVRPRTVTSQFTGLRTFAHGTSRDGKINYSPTCLTKWRGDLQSKPELKSSRGKPCSYTDDEIIQWRLEFDVYSESVITEENFEKKVAKKYPKLSGAELHEKVDAKWKRFDLDQDGMINFSEFCIVSFCLDCERLATLLKEDGVREVFAKYAKDGHMQEPCVKQLMKDYAFTCTIDADVRKLVKLMDANQDGKVCESDMHKFVENEHQLMDDRLSNNKTQ